MPSTSLTARETQILLTAWAHCVDPAPKIDYSKLASLVGLGTPASATTSFHGARKKFLAETCEGREAERGERKKGKKRKRRAENAEGGDGEEVETEREKVGGKVVVDRREVTQHADEKKVDVKTEAVEEAREGSERNALSPPTHAASVDAESRGEQ